MRLPSQDEKIGSLLHVNCGELNARYLRLFDVRPSYQAKTLKNTLDEQSITKSIVVWRRKLSCSALR